MRKRRSLSEKNLEAEAFYIAWLYDLAILDRHLLRRQTFRPVYSVHIWRADRSDAYVDSITHPELFLILVYTHSYLEKGLKYLCLINDPGTSYRHVKGYRHDLRKAWGHLQRLPAGTSLEARMRGVKVWGLFISLLRLDHPGLRYLDIPGKLTVDLRKLSRLVTTFKEFLLLQRRDVVYGDPATHAALKSRGGRIRASFTPRRSGSQTIDWEKCIVSIEP